MTESITNKDVLLYIPNLIGYTRVLLSLASFFLMIILSDLWLVAILMYLGSFIADLFDGMAARKFNQCSEFGGLLDMITDRCSTLGLFFVLYGEYGYEANDDFTGGCFKLLFIFLAILDISSHWCQMYAAASLKVHHKSAESNANRFFLVRYYYDCYPFFGYCCVSAEITYVVMYVLKHTIVETSRSFFISSMRLLLVVCIPGCAIKQIVNFFQLFSSCNAVALDDAKRKTQ